MSKNRRVLVAMSGGVDSSVAAILLMEQGYEVIGLTMKTWDYESSGSSKKETGCCSLDSINDARNIAVDLGFHHNILDIRDEFGDFVIDYFTDEYMIGRTPNPCVLCNTHIKWEALLKRADKLGCDFIATGHYANIKNKDGRYFISKGKDLNKDQSYALWGISQENLSRTIFPLGNLEKNQIKKIALERGYENLVKKSESYEICFVPDNDYRSFLKNRVKDIDKKIKKGKFITETGDIVGTHQGYPYYTIGQRKGLGLALGYPVYVTNIDVESNTVTVGSFDELKRNGMYVDKLNFMKYENISGKVSADTKIRYNDLGSPSVIEKVDNTIKVYFGSSVNAITPGQAAVFYEGDDIIGGGWIKSSFDQNKINFKSKYLINND
ncbi:MAG: tRNA 2-thiouridine(34) synthase MnmA [Cytophagales bacterium]|nr:tRNA 2-thiouridine(34) synthase MnmA [Flammeovirgaceae bacterium]PDH43736.1 MAG: tRNA 2-thiouridine(34) synthase MnmA [Rhodothermaeota bacterium MED-G18]|tara:strand:- start:5465 stop:6607 length:1143 start_codon:yes stop_codon:yes gene_type:complete